MASAAERISQIYRRNDDIGVPGFILSGAPNFHHFRTKLGTSSGSRFGFERGLRAYIGRLGKSLSSVKPDYLRVLGSFGSGATNRDFDR